MRNKSIDISATLRYRTSVKWHHHIDELRSQLDITISRQLLSIGTKDSSFLLTHTAMMSEPSKLKPIIESVK